MLPFHKQFQEVSVQISLCTGRIHHLFCESENFPTSQTTRILHQKSICNWRYQGSVFSRSDPDRIKKAVKAKSRRRLSGKLRHFLWINQLHWCWFYLWSLWKECNREWRMKKGTSNVKVMTKSILFYVWRFAEIKVCLKFGNVKSLFQKYILVKS